MIQMQLKANAFGGTFAKPLSQNTRQCFAKEPPSQRTKTRQNERTNNIRKRRAKA